MVTKSFPLLCDDMVMEILTRLSVKSLLRFKCVSKSWCNLIKSDDFISTHSCKYQSNNKLVVMRYRLVQQPSEEERADISFYDQPQEECAVFSFHDMDSPQLQELWPSLSTSTRFHNPLHYRRHRLIGPCNGLVLINDWNDVFIFNPSLRELKLLPQCPFSDPRGYYHYSPRESRKEDHVLSGWGFGSTGAHDFNVVHLQCCYTLEYDADWDIVSKSSSLKAHLYKSTTRSWKDLGHVDSKFVSYGFAKSELFFNGACHWHTNLLAERHVTILTFDMDTEIFRQLDYPKEKEFIGITSLMVLNECLAFIWAWYRGSSDQQHEVWVMKEYGIEESWSILYVIGPHGIENSFLNWENELLFENGEGQLASCSLDTNEIKRFPIHGVKQTIRAATFKESLISPSSSIN